MTLDGVDANNVQVQGVGGRIGVWLRQGENDEREIMHIGFHLQFFNNGAELIKQHGAWEDYSA